MIIDPMFLSVTLGDEVGFVSLKGAVGLQFDLINPFASDGFLVRRESNQVPCIVLFKGKEFSFHGTNPIFISSCFMVTRLFRPSLSIRQERRMSRECRKGHQIAPVGDRWKTHIIFEM